MSTAFVCAVEQLTLFDAGIDVARLRRTCEVLMTAKKSKNTQRNYDHAWKLFTRWCRDASRCPLPATAETVCLFVASELERAMHVTTIRVRVAGIAERHIREALPSPVTAQVQELLCNAVRALQQGSKPKRAVTVDHLRDVAAIGSLDRPIDVRDRTLFLLLFALGWRRGVRSLRCRWRM